MTSLLLVSCHKKSFEEILTDSQKKWNLEYTNSPPSGEFASDYLSFLKEGTFQSRYYISELPFYEINHDVPSYSWSYNDTDKILMVGKRSFDV
ncbi:hypothetical protein [Flavobacterium rhizosphaerae]|uniref:Uncharacterized protein n=1 Tax=Flavobacterium rhizosphaerae TaxID=3163298 RepID=A0ABW8YVE6_9FLAO